MDNEIENLFSEPFPLFQQLIGKGKGTVYELSIEVINVGREPNNDIVLDDESVSRQHAKISKTPDGSWIITDNKSRNGLLINSQKTESAILRDGDMVQIGKFAFRFKVPLNKSSVGEPNQMGSPVQGDKSQSIEPYSGIPKIRVPHSVNPLRIGLLIVLVGGIAYMLMNGDKTGTSPEQQVGQNGQSSAESGVEDGVIGSHVTDLQKQSDGRSQTGFKVSDPPKINDELPRSEISGLEDPTLKRAEQELAKLDFQNSAVKSSEGYFRRGQREYFNKNYHRAIQDFLTAKNLYQGHPLAERYFKLAIRQAEIEAEKNRELGVKYFESLQYDRALYHFEEAISLMSHSESDPKIMDCKKYIELSRQRKMASEVFP